MPSEYSELNRLYPLLNGAAASALAAAAAAAPYTCQDHTHLRVSVHLDYMLLLQTFYFV